MIGKRASIPYASSFIAAVLLAGQAVATPAHRCDACVKRPQFEGIALQNATGALSTHYVYSLPGKTIFRFDVYRRCAGDQQGSKRKGSASLQVESARSTNCPDGYQYHAIETDVGKDVSDFFQDMIEAWRHYGNSFHARVSFDFATDFPGADDVAARNGPSNAYRFINDGQFRAGFIGAYTSTITGLSKADTIRQLLGQSTEINGEEVRFTLSDEVSLTSRIQFNDGSSVIVRMADNYHVELVPGTAFDAGNNLIPDPSHNPGLPGANPGPLFGGWNPRDLEQWLAAATHAGIPVRHKAGESGYAVSCAYAEGTLIECIVRSS